MKSLTFLYASFSVIASLVFSPVQAAEKLNEKEPPQTLVAQLPKTSNKELYQWFPAVSESELEDKFSMEFEDIGKKTVHRYDILYFKSLYKKDAQIDWKKLAICSDWVEEGCILLNKVRLEEKQKGLALLQRAAEAGSLRAHEELIDKVMPAFSEETKEEQKKAREISIHYLTQLRSILPTIGLSLQEEKFMQAKHAVFLGTDDLEEDNSGDHDNIEALEDYIKYMEKKNNELLHLLDELSESDEADESA